MDINTKNLATFAVPFFLLKKDSFKIKDDKKNLKVYFRNETYKIAFFT